MNYKHLLLICVLGASFTACTLDENPRDQIPEEEAYTSEESIYLNTVATLYSYIGGKDDGQGLQGTCRGVYDLQTFGSDEAMIPTRGADWYDGGIWQDMYRHSWTAGHELVEKSWLYLYKVIALCNRSLEQIDAHKNLLSEEKYVDFCAEVRAIRAIYYWYLMDLFGRVPLMTSTGVPMNEVQQSERSEVFDFIYTELRDVFPHLPYERSVRLGDYYGRVTLPVVYFVLAKLMLNAEVYTGKPRWEECIKYCDLIEKLGYELEISYETNFQVNNETSMENIWTIPMDKDLYNNQMQYLFRSYHYRHAAAYGFTGENGTSATRNTLLIFGFDTPEEDPRFELNYWSGAIYDLNNNLIIDRDGHPLIYDPWMVNMDVSGSPFVETAGARMKKYAIDKNAVKDGKLMDNDIVLFRFADVLLMRAEAKMQLGLDGYDDFKAVRERAGAPERPLTQETLLDERLMELCWEGWRRQDLIRFKRYESLYNGPNKVDESDGHTTVFPIPGNVITLNHNIVQNPGY